MASIRGLLDPKEEPAILPVPRPADSLGKKINEQFDQDDIQIATEPAALSREIFLDDRVREAIISDPDQGLTKSTETELHLQSDPGQQEDYSGGTAKPGMAYK
jgi:hypothetical protein